MTIQQTFYEKQAAHIIKNLNKRHMAGSYCATKEEATALALSLMPDGTSISWGGSMSIMEAGLIDALYTKGSYTLYDRAKCAPEEVNDVVRKSFFADFYLMSTNAITLDGELVNIDGMGNRVAAMIFGPNKVIMLVGMNKVTTTVEEAYNRVRNTASPQNTVRLNKQTPCAINGVCGNCLCPDCICMQTVITRNSRIPDRIHVILVGESLGY